MTDNHGFIAFRAVLNNLIIMSFIGSHYKVIIVGVRSCLASRPICTNIYIICAHRRSLGVVNKLRVRVRN